MTIKCPHGDYILAQARTTAAVSLAVGISIGILLGLLYWVTKWHLRLRGKQSTTNNCVARTGAIQKQALQPPRQKIKYQTSNSTTISGTSDDQGEKNHRYQHAKAMLPMQSEAQQRGRNRVPVASPDMCVDYKNNPSYNDNPYLNQYNEEDEKYVSFKDPSQQNDEDIYLALDDSVSSQQHTMGRDPGSKVTYSNINRHPEQHDEEPTYANLQNNSRNSEEYAYVTMPYVAQAVANQPQTNQGYLFMGTAPPRPPRR